LFFDFDEHLNVEGHDQIALSIATLLNSSIETSKNEVLSSLNVGDRYPRFSNKNNNLLTFQSWRDGNMELFTADSLLQSQVRLTWNNEDELHPWLSPDGHQLVFTEGDQSSNHTNVAIMDMNGNNRRYITSDENTYGAIPSFDYTGTKIAYAEWKSSNGVLTQPYIVIYDLLTGNKDKITPADYESWRPIFSPDNTMLYYIAKKDYQFDIYTYRFEDGKNANLTDSGFDEWDPVISSDGKKLVYAGKENDNWDLFMIHLETGSRTRLTKSKGDEWDPCFSNCGQYVYYAATYGLRNGIFRITLN